MKTKILSITIIVMLLLFIPSSSFAHKLIPTNGLNSSFEDALEISNHKISWVVYEEINDNELYYTFNGKKGDLFFASIVIPKLENLKNFSPSLAFIGYESHLELIQEFEINNTDKNFLYKLPEGYDVFIFDYSGSHPSNEFYEPFGQVTYWERQEVSFDLPADGTYYLAVYHKNSDPGKYALAIGTIEDFSIYDFFTMLPYAWLSTKLFFNDYVSAVIAISIFLGILSLVGFIVYRKFQN